MYTYIYAYKGIDKLKPFHLTRIPPFSAMKSLGLGIASLKQYIVAADPPNSTLNFYLNSEGRHCNA